MSAEMNDVREAARLIDFGLRAKLRPAQDPEYARLVDRYLDRLDFRGIVRAVADGLALEILDIGEHGLVLGPREGSAFALKPADFRATQTVDDRLLDGLAQLAIAASVFPRPRDLEEDATFARPPVTVEEVDENLRRICARLEEEAENRPDPEAGEEGLDEAWRVYARRLSAMETKDDRAARRTTRRIVEANLERLREYGSFTRDARPGATRYQP